MYSLLTLACVSFLFALVLTPLCRNLARRWGLVDQPDGARKVHTLPIPRMGGIPIVLSIAASFALLILSPLRASIIVEQSLPFAWKLMPAVALIFLIGLIDDLRGLTPWQKLIGEVAAGLLAFAVGVQIQGVGGHAIESWWWTLPLTLGWFVACTNAFNLIDGVDGLAAGVGLFATVTILASALLHNNVALALATAPLAGSLLGFLRYNFNPASIFLGDSGSLTIGFLLGCYGVIWSQKSATLLGMTAPLMVLAIPILDVVLSILRRFLRGQPIFGADRGHIHHRLLDRGLTPRRVALLLYGVCGVFAALSLTQSVFQNRYAGLILVLFCAVAWIGVHNLGYVEFRVARRMLLGGAFQNMLNGQLLLRKFEDSIAAAPGVEQCWRILCQTSRDFGFDKVEMYVDGETYVEQIGQAKPDDCWNVIVFLSDYEWVSLTREHGSQVLPMIVAPFAEAIRRALLIKLRELEPPAEEPKAVAVAVS